MHAPLRSSIRFAWRQDEPAQGFRTGVSLHSHTSHSKETLDFIPRFSRKLPLVSRAVSAQERRYRALHGRDLDYYGVWWTPPLGPREALDLERGQIAQLGLRPLVSISDHDNIEAPLLLRVLDDARDTPISVEWTVPWGPTFFHLGVHNLPPRRALDRMEAMAAFTAAPAAEFLPDILDWLSDDPQTLIVFNHPCWDEKGIGQETHCRVAHEFLAKFQPYLHAVESNGLRPWTENRKNMALGVCFGKPPVSGGDRHTLEPNALVNLTNARTFGEFVEEVREDGLSHVLVMPQYRESLGVRVMRGVADVMRDREADGARASRWTDRVFVRGEANRPPRALSEIWTAGDEPWSVRLFEALVRLSSGRRVQTALRGLMPQVQELSV